MIADKRTKAENYYRGQHNVKLTQLSSQEQEKEKQRERDSLLCTYEDNFQLCLLEQLVRLNSWRDVEIITSIPISYMAVKMENDKNENIVDAKWHSGYCKSLCELLNW